ncbi:MAG: ABC transporter ATP-binding protein [Lachnospiraceae bacterium]|nr:ABC transporter ATP-binding protein [Lachnospiraceae bacterium]
MSEKAILKVVGLSVSFPKVDGKRGEKYKVISNMDLEINEGEFVCVLGPSGCGKSTLLNCVAGFIPYEGIISFKNHSITGPGPERGVMFQEYGLFPWFNVEQNIGYGPKKRKWSKKEQKELVDKYVKMVGLENFRKSYPNHLSGGMKQRVSLARVLANKPEFLLMDEPFAALDEQTRQKLQEELLQVWEQDKITCMFITHSISEAVFLADRVIVLMPNPGRVALNLRIDLPRMRDRNDPRLLEFSKAISDVLFHNKEA